VLNHKERVRGGFLLNPIKHTITAPYSGFELSKGKLKKFLRIYSLIDQEKYRFCLNDWGRYTSTIYIWQPFICYFFNN